MFKVLLVLATKGTTKTSGLADGALHFFDLETLVKSHVEWSPPLSHKKTPLPKQKNTKALVTNKEQFS